MRGTLAQLVAAIPGARLVGALGTSTLGEGARHVEPPATDHVMVDHVVVHDDVIDHDVVRRGRLNVSGTFAQRARTEGADEARAGNGRHELCERTAHQCVLNMVSRAVNASEAWSVSENGILRPLISW